MPLLSFLLPGQSKRLHLYKAQSHQWERQKENPKSSTEARVVLMAAQYLMALLILLAPRHAAGWSIKKRAASLFAMAFFRIWEFGKVFFCGTGLLCQSVNMLNTTF